MTMEEATEVMMEHKEELMMVSGSNPTRRPAHFLNPSLSSPNTTCLLYSPNRYIHTYHNLSRHVSFTGWKNPLPKWNEWVDRMELLHHSTWHNACIHHAIMASRIHINQDVNLVLALAERWFNVTNTFIFPWGEASVTLEDVFVLGGYSVLGRSVVSPIQGRHQKEFVRIDERLNKVRGEMNRSKSKKVGQVMWMDHYMGSGSEVEHVAFLVLWLSRYVFPFSRDVVGKNLHKIAFGLARGTRVALAPAVLAYLYKDLSSLKEQIVDFSKDKAMANKLNLWSQMKLVQIWAWERFPSINPQHNIIGEGELRMGRWNNIKTESDIESVRLVIDYADEEFVWRPYGMSGKFDFYPDNEKWISICPGMQEDYLSFCKFVRASELVGLDCLESYSPHRVSMQFGIDQDIPGKVACFNGTPEIAWQNFNKLIGDERLYIPSKTNKSAITQRYLNWWKDSKLFQENVVDYNDGILHATASRSLKKHKAVKDNVTSKRKKVNSGRFVFRMTRARKSSATNVKMGNDRSIEIIELDKISDDDTSSPLVAPQILKCPPGFKPDETVQMELLNEKAALSENVIEKHEEVVNNQSIENIELDEISDDGTSFPLVDSQIPNCPPGFKPDETVQIKLINEKTALSENVIGKHEEVVNNQSIENVELDELSDDDTSFPLVYPQIPNCPPGFELDETVQMKLLNEKTALTENVIGKHEEVVNNQSIENIGLDEISDDGTSFLLVAPQVPKYPPDFGHNDIVKMELPNERSDLSENAIARHDEVMTEHPGEGTVSVHNDDEEEKSKAVRLKKLRELPLDSRLCILERQAAKLKKSRLGSSRSKTKK